MKSILRVTAQSLLMSALSLAVEPPVDDLAADSPLRVDSSIKWTLETIGNATVLRCHPAKGTAIGFETHTADLVAAILTARAKSPLPLERIALGDYLVRCESLQIHLLRELEARHPLSLMNALPRPNSMPVRGAETAPSLAPIALGILKNSPDFKLIEQAASNSGYRIKDVNWHAFQVTHGPGPIRLQGEIVIHLEPQPVK
ncbi:hypothetical protein OVA24_13275 [Luteolibacter sp. SL250]|uniref:hypothetical protein n=1 Tax=Luteolibacter sp. SL250 TaxID=2995170 RepID=UPI00226E6056|nr:hypothetical protein [Luteolibacter sp. SL250]WAC18209.1 hypothetical protein OVA24_13275 [Luteolibacter sp. SL250]